MRRTTSRSYAVCLLPLLFFLFGLEPAGFLLSQEETNIPLKTETYPSKEDIEAKISSLETNEKIEEETKSKLLDLYKSAANQIQLGNKDGEELARYKALIENGPKDIQRIREQLKTKQPSIEEFLERQKGLPISELEAKLTVDQALLTNKQLKKTELAKSITDQEKRPSVIREEIATARQRLTQIENELSTLPQSPNSQEVEARRTLLKAQKFARSAELLMLEQELVIYQTRLDLFMAQRDLIDREIIVLESQNKGLRDLLNELRRVEAQKEQSEAENVRQATLGKHPSLVKIAEDNSRFSKEFARVTRLIESAGLTHQNIVEDLNKVRAEHKNAQTRLEQVGLSSMLGEIFLEQRKNLPNIDQYKKLTAVHRDQINAVRVGQIEIDEKRKALVDIDGHLKTLSEQATPPIPQNERESFYSEARKLFEDQSDLIGKTNTAYGRYLKVLSDLDIDQRQLAESVTTYKGFLDDHLLWTPSTNLMNAETFSDLVTSIRSFLTPSNWQVVISTFRRSLRDQPVTAILFVLSLGSIVFLRRLSKNKIQEYSGRVGKKVSDRFSLTLMGLFFSIIIAAPISLAMLMVGYLLIESANSSEFDYALGSSLLHTAGLVFTLQLIRSICMPTGVGHVHFKWSEKTLLLVRKCTLLILFFSVPGIWLTHFCEALGQDEYLYSLGRVAFILSMLTLGLVSIKLLSLRTGIFRKGERSTNIRWLYKIRFLLVFFAPAIFFTLGILATAGYFYTARQLDHRVLFSALSIFVAVLINNLILRWLVLARTTLAISRAKEKREAALLANESSASGETVIELDLPEIDLATVKEQAQRLFGTAIFFGVVLLLLATWAPVLPALSVLDRGLWDVHVLVKGEEVLKTITIANILAAILIGFLGILASRNLPGLLEIAILRRLSLDAGSRYAFTTIGQYILVATGVALALKTIGVAWSNIQWLVAALSVGLGFGLQEIFANFMSGLIILLEQPIRVGDTVTVGEVSGTVTRIRIRATTITDWDHKELVVPNKSFITGQLINWSLSNPVTRLVVKVGIAYGSDTEKALRLMVEVAKKNASVISDPEPTVFFVGFGESSLDFDVRVFVKELTNTARTRIRHELHMEIDKVFREHDIEIAFPQRDIHIKPNTDVQNPLVGADCFESDIDSN